MSDLTYEVPCQTDNCSEQHTVNVIGDTIIKCSCGETFHYKNDEEENPQAFAESFAKEAQKLFDK